MGFFLSDTGGGHRAAARAIEAALQLKFPGQFTCEFFDVFRTCGVWPLTQAPELYPRWVRFHQPSYDLSVRMADALFRTRLGRDGLPRLFALRRSTYEGRLRTWNVVVVVHAAFGGFALAVRRALQLEIPVVTVVTDLASPHAGWFHPGVDRILVPSDSAYKRALQLGVDPAKVRLVGLPIHPKFGRLPLSRRECRHRLGWESDSPTVLLVSGAEGMGNIPGYVEALDGLGAQLVVVTGRNEALAHEVRGRRWRGVVHVYGFVQDMEVFMGGADVLVGKPGPGIIAEAATMGLPMVLIESLGNERANVALVESYGAGQYARSPTEAGALVQNWLASPEELRQRTERARAMAFPHAALDGAEEIWAQTGSAWSA